MYYQGLDLYDVDSIISFIGIPGGHTFHNLFYKNIDNLTEKMTKELQVIVDEGLQDEIKSKIEYELANKYTAFEIEEFNTLFNANYGSIPSNI